jgi:hypothetical protein
MVIFVNSRLVKLFTFIDLHLVDFFHMDAIISIKCEEKYIFTNKTIYSSLFQAHLNIARNAQDRAGMGRAFGNIGNAYSASGFFEQVKQILIVKRLFEMKEVKYIKY